MNESLRIDGHTYQLTTEHAASSYGIPVLVAQHGTALGPGNTGLLRVEKASDEAIQGLQAAGYAFVDAR